MLVYRTKTFARFARRSRLADAALMEAIDRGLVDAGLGGGLIKQRVPRSGAGSRGGYRTLIAYRHGELSVFLYGFGKSDRGNIDDDEADDLRAIGGVWLGDTASIARDLAEGILIEVEP